MLSDAHVRRLRFERDFPRLAIYLMGLALAVGLLLALFWASPAAAQPSGGSPAPGEPQPVWLTLLTAALPVVLGLIVGAKPLLKLSQFLATKHTGSVAANAGLTVVEHLSASAEKYLEESEHDIDDIATDPAKRAAALKALTDRAKAEVPGALADATAAFGASFLDGKVSAALDTAQAKQQALASPRPPA